MESEENSELEELAGVFYEDMAKQLKKDKFKDYNHAKAAFKGMENRAKNEYLFKHSLIIWLKRRDSNSLSELMEWHGLNMQDVSVLNSFSFLDRASKQNL